MTFTTADSGWWGSARLSAGYSTRLATDPWSSCRGDGLINVLLKIVHDLIGLAGDWKRCRDTRPCSKQDYQRFQLEWR